MPDRYMQPIERFNLPENWSPDEIVCMVVPVPNDAQYFAMAIGLLDDLTMSRNYARDPTKTGAATVSRTWKRALSSRPILFLHCEELDMAFDMRVKPGQPWVTEVSTDGGLTWHDAIIQPHWETGVQPVQPSTSNINDALDWASAVYRNLYIDFIVTIQNSIDNGDNRDETVQKVLDTLTPYGAGATIRPTIGDLYDTYVAADPALQAQYQTDCPYSECFKDLADYFQATPNWIVGLNNWLVNEVTCSVDAVNNALNSLVTALGDNTIFGKIEGSGFEIGQGGSFGVDCSAVCTYGGTDYKLVGPFIHQFSSHTALDDCHWFNFPKPLNWDFKGIYCHVLNGPTGVTTLLKSGGSCAPSGAYDIAGNHSFYVSGGHPADETAGQHMLVSGLDNDIWNTCFGLTFPNEDGAFGPSSHPAAEPLGGFQIQYGSDTGLTFAYTNVWSYLLFSVP